MESPSHAFFEAVVNRDYDMLSGLYAMNARNAIMSFLSMRSRWSTAETRESRAGKFASMSRVFSTEEFKEVHDGVRWPRAHILLDALKDKKTSDAVMIMYFGLECCVLHSSCPICPSQLESLID